MRTATSGPSDNLSSPIPGGQCQKCKEQILPGSEVITLSFSVLQSVSPDVEIREPTKRFLFCSEEHLRTWLSLRHIAFGTEKD